MSCDFTEVTVEGDTQPTAGAAPSTQTWIANLPVDLTVPAATGGNTPVSYALSPALPTGLTFDPMTRRITGTPSTASATATYTMTATDFNGDTATVQFEGAVPPEAPVTISPTALTVNENTSAMYTVVLDSDPGTDVTVTPGVADDGGQVTFEPAALTFSATNWNTAQQINVVVGGDSNTDNEAVVVLHTVTGGATGNAFLNLTINDMSPDFGSVTAPDVTLGAGTLYDTLSALRLPAASAGSAVVSYTLTPPIPGMTLDRQSRDWVGTPPAVADAVMVTYTATDEDGDTASLEFEVTVAAVVVISPVNLVVGEDASRTYTIRLGIAPRTVMNSDTDAGSAVMMTPNSDNTDVTFAPAVLTFGATDWNNAQTVTVSAAADGDADNDVATITHTVAATQGNYRNINTADPVSVTVIEAGTDFPGLVFNSQANPGAVRITEGSFVSQGLFAHYHTVELAIRPSGTVTVELTVTPEGHDLTLASTSLTFFPTNWNLPQDVQINAALDADTTDDTVTITHTASGVTEYEGVTAVRSAVSVDHGAIVVGFERDNITVNERDGQVEICVLISNPVNQNIGSRGSLTLAYATADGTATDTSNDYNAFSGTLSAFTTGQPRQCFNVIVNQDMVGESPETFTVELTRGSAETTPEGLEIIVQPNIATVTIYDEGTPMVVIAPTALSVNEGATTTYTVALGSSPTGGDVTVTPSSDNTVVTPTPATLVFTTANWNTAQTVTISSAVDADADDDTVTISHTATNTQPPVAAVEVTVVDTESMPPPTVMVVIAPTALSVNEDATTTYTVALDSSPTGGDVTVTPSSDNTVVTPTPATLVFTTANWNTAQTVTISSAVDADADDDTVTISHTATNTQPPVAAVEVTVVDTESMPPPTVMVVIASTALSVNEGATTTYTVALSDMPTGDVTVTPATTAGGITLSGALTFSTTTWNTPQAVTVTATEDFDADDETATITHAVSGYGSVTAADVTVMVDDDETAGVTIDPTAVRVDEGGTTSYTVKLDTLPRGDVTIRLTGAGEITGYPGELTFTTGNWNTARAVPVDARIDRDGDTGTATIAHAVSGYGSVATADTVTVTITDVSSAPDFGGLTVPDQNYTIYEVMPQLTLPEARDGIGDGVLVYTLTPAALPAGLTYTATAAGGTLGGMPTTMTPGVMLTWTVTDRDGDYSSLTFRVAIVKTDRLDNLNRVILPEVARAMADDQVGAISRRIRQAGDAASGPMAGSLTLGGQSTLPGMLTTHGRAYLEGTLNLKSLLGGSDFVLPLHASGAGRATGLSGVTLWGGGNYRSLSGNGDGVDWGGDMFSAHLGADTRLRDDLLAGVAVSWSEVDLDYDYTGFGTGDYDVSLTSVHPYVGWTALAGRLDVWATVGYGWGELEIANDTGSGPAGWRASSDVTMQTVGAGGSAQVLEGSAATVRLKGEALQTTMDVEGNARASISALKVEARRLRVGLEASRTHQLAIGGQLIPTLEVGMRHDAGDGRTGTGAEVGGSVRYTDAAHGLTIESHGRVLLGHGGDYEDWGVGGSVRLAAGQDGHGLSFSLQPTWGATASRVAQVWAQEAAATVSSAAPPRDGRVDLNVGYGLGWTDTLVTPYGQLTLTNGQTRAYRLGSRMRLGDGIALNLEGTRQETAAQPVDHGILLQIGLGF